MTQGFLLERCDIGLTVSFNLLLSNFHIISDHFCSGDKTNFLNDLAAKMAAGPPKKPVGLVKPNAMNDEEKKKRYEESAEAQKKISDIVKEGPAQGKDS